MEFVIVLVVAIVAFGLGVFNGPKVTALYATYSQGRAVTAAKALVAKADADAKALEAARKTLASQPAPVVAATGPTGTK